MSGFAVGVGAPSQQHVVDMLARMKHRGPFRSGVARRGRCLLAQNYLRADLSSPSDAAVPVVSEDGATTVCYDGQIANWRERSAELGVPSGAFQDERLLLALYQRHGAGLFEQLDDAIFAFALTDGDHLLVARDLLGIKTLFYGREGDTLYFASELKALTPLLRDIREFPPGHYMDAGGALVPFASLPTTAPAVRAGAVDTFCRELREIIQRKVAAAVDFRRPTAGLLSGGMDSSVINALAAGILREREGPEARLTTYAIGLGESSDIRSARLMAAHLGTSHHELLVELPEVVEALPEVIYHLESFDPSLVRSAVANYLISKRAGQDGVEILLSGEGGDEIFCGYQYLKEYPLDELVARQVECLRYLHNNAALRLDRMNACHSIRVVAPLISGELLAYAMSLPPQCKQRPDGDTRIEKWIFRKAYESLLPAQITGRLKQEFSQGSGAAGELPQYFEERVTDHDFRRLQQKYPLVRSKEEAHYLQLFVEHFGDGPVLETVGQWPLL